MLRRGFAPPGQPASSGNGASAVLISHRARRPEVPALLGSRSVPAAPVTTDAAYRAAAPWLPALQYPGQRSSVACAQVPAWLVAELSPGGGPSLRLFIPWPEPRSPSRRERRNGAGRKGPKGPRRIRQPAWPRCSAARRGAAAPQPPPLGDSSAGLLLPGRYRSHRPAPGIAESPAAPPPPAGRSPLLHRADQSRCGAAAGRHGP